ncbi:hypothetical protein [Amycolatopsis pigmentata]|uniref:Uncharacterized protein n=1 Tax=Amycolatopsis pigmentata TaxID=450801 RepID=A0ABW5FLQ1_9PSEU
MFSRSDDHGSRAGLRPGTVRMWRFGSHFSSEDGTARAFSVQSGPRRQAVLGGQDRVGDEPRLVIDFARGRPLLSARGQQVGERHKNVVRLWTREYRIHRRRFRTRLRFDVIVAESVVLEVCQQSEPGRTVRTLETHHAPDLDPLVVLSLILLEGRPDRMTILNEAFRS